PSVVSYVVPALMMYFALDDKRPEPSSEVVKTRFGAKRTVGLFILTIIWTVILHNYFHLPPAFGMMSGLGVYMLFSHYIQQFEIKKVRKKKENNRETYETFDIFNKVKRAEWDTLFFFYGVILSVGGLAVLGYLELMSHYLYLELGKSFS